MPSCERRRAGFARLSGWQPIGNLGGIRREFSGIPVTRRRYPDSEQTNRDAQLAPKNGQKPKPSRDPAYHTGRQKPKKAELKTLNFTGPRELLAEKFHIHPGLLTRLNPKASLETAGTKIMVPNFARKPSEAKVAKVVVDKSAHTVRALDGDGKLISFYPASVGSEERPAPSGTRTIRSVAENPTYTYSPKLHFKGVKATKSFTIAPGPKNPVGNTWIDLGDSYGIHGTPEPQNIGRTQLSQIGTPRRWARWSTRESRPSSSTECSRRIVRHLGDAGGDQRGQDASAVESVCGRNRKSAGAAEARASTGCSVLIAHCQEPALGS
jgi:lipoprotein-anchoring transpeptidase ErfK/SrfK